MNSRLVILVLGIIFSVGIAIILVAGLMFWYTVDVQAAPLASTHVVPTCDEAGFDSALAAAAVDPGLAEITFPPTCTGNIPISTAKSINYDVVIDGENRITLVAAGTNRHFNLQANGDLTLRRIIVRDGNLADNGGAILANNAQITTDNVVFRNNLADGKSGGAIHMTNSEGRFQTTSFYQNSSGAYGGALTMITSSVWMTDSYFLSNQDSPGALGSRGGAIYRTGGGILKITGGTFRDNQAIDGNGGAIHSTNGSLEIEASDFYSNSAGSPASTTVLRGGAVHVNSANPLIVTASAFRDNYAAGRAGGLYAADSKVHVSTTTFRNNTVDNGTTNNDQGGGVWLSDVLADSFIERSTFQDNYAETSGGAIYINSGSPDYRYPELRQSSIISNSSSTGAAIMIFSVGSSTNTATMDNLTVHNNHARTGSAPAIRVNNSDLTVQHMTITDNDSAFYMHSAHTLTILNSVLDNEDAECNASTGTYTMIWSSATDTSCVGSGGSNLIIAAPLWSLQPNGGNMLSRLPMPASAIVDVVPPGSCLSHDQRGMTRPQGTACDMGAIELSTLDLALATIAAATATAAAEQTATAIPIHTATAAANQTATAVAEQTATQAAALTATAQATPTPTATTTTPSVEHTPSTTLTPGHTPQPGQTPQGTPQPDTTPGTPLPPESLGHTFFLNPISK